MSELTFYHPTSRWLNFHKFLSCLILSGIILWGEFNKIHTWVIFVVLLVLMYFISSNLKYFFKVVLYETYVELEYYHYWKKRKMKIRYDTLKLVYKKGRIGADSVRMILRGYVEEEELFKLHLGTAAFSESEVEEIYLRLCERIEKAVARPSEN